MSRIPQPPSTRTPFKSTETPVKSRLAVPGSTTPRIRTKSTTNPAKTESTSSPGTSVKSRLTVPAPTPRIRTKSTPKPPPPVQNEPAPTPLSIKEAIALKRAEAKKLATKSDGGGLQASGGFDTFSDLIDAIPIKPSKPEEEDILGRASVKEAIERARNTGTLNITTRALPCLPSALFEIHLGVTPEPLKSVPDEPPLAEPDNQAIKRRATRQEVPAWFEAQDLHVLKAWGNDIIEIQPEISLFGSLKTIDLHKNKLSSLPDSFGDLVMLTFLDLSHNALTSLPTNIFSLPDLATLNISHNSMTSLPFNSPFSSPGSRSQPGFGGGSLFVPTITRASGPLPRLLTLDASNNKITASAIDLSLPATLSKIDLSSNPLGDCRALLKAFGGLQKLRELRMEKAEIADGSLTPTLFASMIPFPKLRVIDLGETKVTADAARGALKAMKQELTFDLTSEDPPEGVVRVLVGKRIIREAWELEAERRIKPKSSRNFAVEEDFSSAFSSNKSKAPIKAVRSEVVKESWEIEAEQGLLTEGAKRRARATAAAAQNAQTKSAADLDVPSRSPTPSLSLTSSQYYSQASQTLTLPPSTPLPKVPNHARAFSLASPSSSFSSGLSPTAASIALPTPTLPLSLIVTLPFAQTLKVLILTNRRMDRSFSLPSSWDTGGETLLPNLEELDLEGCGLSDTVSVFVANSGDTTPPRTSEAILPLLTKLFPSLRTLNLSHNALTSSSLLAESLSSLILSAPPRRKGLKQLRLRGNRLSDLTGLQGVAELFKGNREVPGWNLDELDLRDNEIGRLPPELGLMPLDVFLVDGNTFRVPQRRVWEREGTKGLLSWLRGRIE